MSSFVDDMKTRSGAGDSSHNASITRASLRHRRERKAKNGASSDGAEVAETETVQQEEEEKVSRDPGVENQPTGSNISNWIHCLLGLCIITPLAVCYPIYLFVLQDNLMWFTQIKVGSLCFFLV